jgi:hypothetical protein
VRAALIALGTIVMGYAVLGAATDPDLKPGGVVLFLATGLVAHDAVFLPLTIAAGALIARLTPRWARPSVSVAAIVSLAVGLAALPLVLGYGRSADNPSILPRAYGHGLLLVVTLIWAVALVAMIIARRAQPVGTLPTPAGATNPSPADATGPTRPARAEDGDGHGDGDGDGINTPGSRFEDKPGATGALG